MVKVLTVTVIGGKERQAIYKDVTVRVACHNGHGNVSKMKDFLYSYTENTHFTGNLKDASEYKLKFEYKCTGKASNLITDGI